MKAQPSLMILSAVSALGALLLGCEGGITQIDPGATASESELVAAYVDPISPLPAGVRATDLGDKDKLPLMDGDAQDKEWNAAKPLYVYVSGDQAMGGAGFYVELRAIWSDEQRFNPSPDNVQPLLRNFLYFMVRYADETFDIFPDYWRYAHADQLGLIKSPVPEKKPGMPCDSVVVQGQNWFRENVGAQEDQISLMFEIEPASSELGTFDEVGCQVACHGGQFGTVPQGKLDVWTWRAGRTNAQETTIYPDLAVILEDGKPRSSFINLDPVATWPGYMEDMFMDGSGIHNDAASRFYPPQRNGYDGQLYIKNESTTRSNDGLVIPGYITEKVVVTHSTGGSEDEVEPVNGGLPTTFYLWGPTAQPLDQCDSIATSRVSATFPKWSERLALGETDVMPGYALFVPNGSAADVRAKAQYKENAAKRFPIWSLEVRRPMVTGTTSASVSNADDISLDPEKEYTFTIAIFNRSSQIHSGSGPLKLKFAPSVYSHKPGGVKAS